jgi:hypothetical protein
MQNRLNATWNELTCHSIKIRRTPLTPSLLLACPPNHFKTRWRQATQKGSSGAMTTRMGEQHPLHRVLCCRGPIATLSSLAGTYRNTTAKSPFLLHGSKSRIHLNDTALPIIPAKSR